MIKIAIHNVQKYGARGASISLPRVWLKDNRINLKQALPIYRLTVDGNDFLIISSKEATINLESIMNKSTKLINKNTPERNKENNPESIKN